jgi:hypothetical protein
VLIAPIDYQKKGTKIMMDPVSFQRIAEIRQQEYLAIANYERNARPLRLSIMEAASKVIARLKAINETAPAQTVTTPNMTEPCVEC